MFIKGVITFINKTVTFINRTIMFIGRAIIFISKGSLAIRGRLFKITKAKIAGNIKINRYNLKR